MALNEPFGGVGEPAPFSRIPGAGGRRPPRTWGELAVEGDRLVLRLSSWRAILALKRKLSVPLSAVVSVRHDPVAREHVRAKLRRRAGRSGLVRLGAYHSQEGWSFWAIGIGRNAVVVETEGVRYRYVVVEVEDPKSTVELIRENCALEGDAPQA